MNVRGTQHVKPLELEIGKDTVYVRKNILAINEEDFVGWEYDEVQYSKDEYIKLIADKQIILEESQKDANTKYLELDITNSDIETVRQAKKDQLNHLCNVAILGTFIGHNSHTYSFDMEAQDNFNQQFTDLLIDTTIATIDWKTKNAGVVTHTRDEFMALRTDIKNHKLSNIQKYWTLEAQVLNALTKDEITAISW